MGEPNIYLRATALCIALLFQFSKLEANDLVITPGRLLEPPFLATNTIFRPDLRTDFLQLASFDSNSLLLWNWWTGEAGASNLLMAARLNTDGI
jgi:hypothetical protein